MSLLSQNLSLPFFLSGPAPCPYLPGRVERKLFARLSGDKQTDSKINAALTRAGFRRSHNIVYRPACVDCCACVPVRLPILAFRPSRSQRRVSAKNKDLILSVTSTEPTEELYELFLLYQRARHGDSDMAQMTREEFDVMLLEGGAETRLFQLREQKGRLMGVMIADDVVDGFSAVYSFFRPDETRRSLGSQLILTLVDEAARAGLAYVYLGYWIEETRKMSYKARFQPLQTFTPHGWRFEE